MDLGWICLKKNSIVFGGRMEKRFDKHKKLSWRGFVMRTLTLYFIDILVDDQENEWELGWNERTFQRQKQL